MGYNHWIGAVNLGWEATIGSPEEFARCLREAGFHHVKFVDAETMAGVQETPSEQFASREFFEDKYGTFEQQLSIASFQENYRHLYALEAMSLAIINKYYYEGFFFAVKGSL